MSDRELLELAAKAAGVEGGWGERYKVGNDEIDLTKCWFLDAPDCCVLWDPLNDDGDALRLAVGLEMQLRLRHSENEVSVYGAPNGRIDEGVCGDSLAATRRAIVRAAAEIARASSCSP